MQNSTKILPNTCNRKSFIFYAALLLSIIYFEVTPPFFSIGSVLALKKAFIAMVLFLLSTLILAKGHYKFNKYERIFLFCLVPQLFFLIIQYIYLDDVFALNSLCHSLTAIIGVLSFIIFFKGDYNKFYKYLIYLFCAMVVLSLINFILVFWNLNSVHGIILRNPGVTDAHIYNYILGFTNARFYYNGHTILKIAGYFDEPGKLALYIILFIFLNKSTIKSKKVEMILVAGGLATFTLAFYISFSLYMILNLNFKKNIHIFMIIISFFTIFYLSSTSGKTFFDDMIINRLTISEDSNRIIRGDNRTYNMAIGMEKVLEKPLMGYGYSARLSGLGFELSSIVGTLATYGFIGVLCALLPFFLVSFYSYKNKELFMFAPIVALNFIPRGPGFGGLLVLLIFYGIYQECSGFRNRERNAQLQGHR